MKETTSIKIRKSASAHSRSNNTKLSFVGAVFTASKYHKRFSYGFINENNKKMIVTRGIGVSVLPFRFNCPPEIVVIEFI